MSDHQRLPVRHSNTNGDSDGAKCTKYLSQAAIAEIAARTAAGDFDSRHNELEPPAMSPSTKPVDYSNASVAALSQNTSC